MNLCIFEDDLVVDTAPLTLTRPVFELTCGILTLRKKILTQFTGHQIIYFCRDHLSLLLQEQFPDALINQLPEEDTLFINGRVLMNEFYTPESHGNQPVCYTRDERVLAAAIPAGFIRHLTTEENGTLMFQDVPFRKRHDVEWKVLRYPWEYIQSMPAEIETDANRLALANTLNPRNFPGMHVLGEEKVYVGENVRIKPGVVLDAEPGIIVLDDEVIIGHNATVIGPCYIGPRSVISAGANITGQCSIGPVCKIGGEVGETVIQGYTNKKHDGFLGGAYLGEWVNLGAGTTNSDLKNNYSTISMPINGNMVNTGLQFVGCVIGDHTKTSIGTSINTGSVYGVGCNVFGKGFPPKFVPSFTWGGVEQWELYHLDKMLTTAEIVQLRRGVETSATYREMLAAVFEMTTPERENLPAELPGRS
ncbi:MAG TPA: putative sugar nucleotidyl transferase [bacterium]|nr:putative sugar nucleotidyl transferase [bacterium]